MEAIQMDERFYEKMIPAELMPEKKLMFRILQSAIADYYGKPFDMKHSGREQRQTWRRDAGYWLFEEVSSDIFSFVTICRYLGLDADRLRDGIKYGTLSKTVTHNILQEYRKGNKDDR